MGGRSRIVKTEHLRRDRCVLTVLLTVVAVLCLLGIGLYKQPYYPVTWLDEGFVLQASANLIRDGEYALKSVEGFRVLDQPLIANGPGIVLPLSAWFAVLGPGLIQARWLAAAFFILAAVLYFLLGRGLYGLAAAVASVFLALAVPADGFILYGRQALGNVPALAYFSLGYLIWLGALDRRRPLLALGAGLLFALAIITKGQYILVIPALLLMAILEKLYYRKIGGTLPLWVIAGTVGGATLWYLIQLLIVGPDQFADHLDAIRSSSMVTVSAFRPIRLLGNLSYVGRSGYLLFVLPALCYAAWSCRARGAASERQLLLVILVGLWTVWYIIASVGWPRYLFEPYILGLLTTGKLAFDMAHRARQRLSRSPRSAGNLAMSVVAIMLLFAGSVVGTLSYVNQLRRITVEGSAAPLRFAAFLQENVGPRDTIESFEWELDTLADLNYHHPANVWVDRYTGFCEFGDPLEQAYQPWEYNPTYLIDGPFSRRIGLYSGHLAQGCCTLIHRERLYELYRVDVYTPAALPERFPGGLCTPPNRAPGF